MSDEKELFFIINWLDFVDNQSFAYKKKDLSPYFKELFCRLLPKGMRDNNLRVDGHYTYYDYCKKIEGSELKETETKALVKELQWHLLGNKTDYRYLLVAEILYTLETLGFSITEDFEKTLKEELSFSDNKFARCLELVKKPVIIKKKRIKASFAQYIEFIKGLEAYNALPVKHIGVCACMSAGKSSFVNALLGYNILPARNEATTAKITSVYDKDGAVKLIGFAQRWNNICDVNNNLNPQIIESWNGDKEITHIYLQGDMDNIKNDGLVVAVHDTPGVNYSGNSSHHEITMKFFQNNKMDLIIYVANVNYIGTSDEKKFLTELLDKVIRTDKTPVIVAFNKVDTIDLEKKDSLVDSISKIKTDLSNIGFSMKNVEVLPVSSKAAGLFKMAKNGHSKRFTAKEKKAFAQSLFEFNNLYNFGSEIMKPTTGKGILVGDTEYSVSEIEKALEHSGLPNIERFIEKVL